MALIIMAGSALFWTNLNEAGYGDPRTLHAGCPVISGHKVDKLYVISYGCIYS